MKSPNCILPLIACVLTSMTYANLYAQDRTPSPERFFEYLDRNRDGKLDADEIRRMPSSFRTSLEQSGVSLDREISRDVFIREIPKAFEQMRRDRERDESRRRDDSRSRDDDRRRSDDRNREIQSRAPSTNRTSPARETALYTPRKQVPITVNLPRRFEDDDLDGDGQVSYHEWRQSRPPEQRAHFKVYDKNGDGFLTPRELLTPPTTAELIAATSGISEANADPASDGASPTSGTAPGTRNGSREERSFGRSGSRRGGPGVRRDDSSRGDRSRETSGPASTSAPASSGNNVSAEAPGDDPNTRTARLLFAQMDADKNKQITSEEWARSRTVKPKFEAAGIDLSSPMNEQQFIEAYQKAMAK